MYRANNPNAPSYQNYDASQAGMRSTNVTYKRNPGYFERLGSSCMGIVVGLIIIILAFPVLFLNEGRAVQTARSLDEGLKAVNYIKENDPVFESNNGNLIHLFGKLKTPKPISDTPYGIDIYATKLKRHVEMYQWVEHEQRREIDEGERTRVETTYSYTQEWRSFIVNSGGFSQSTTHRNPSAFSPPHTPHTHIQNDVLVGNFYLSKALIDKVNNFKKMFPKELPEGSDLKRSGDYYYSSQNPQVPVVGDVRISFTYAGLSHPNQRKMQDSVSIIAKQMDSRLTGYQTQAGDILEILYDGEKSAEEIFESEHSSNTMLTWVLRLIGWLLMFVGFQLTMNIVRQIVSFIPIVREIVSLATSLIAFSLSSSLSLTVIAIGWLRYRPLLAATILIGAAVPIYLSKRKAKNDKMGDGGRL